MVVHGNRWRDRGFSFACIEYPFLTTVICKAKENCGYDSIQQGQATGGASVQSGAGEGIGDAQSLRARATELLRSSLDGTLEQRRSDGGRNADHGRRGDEAAPPWHGRPVQPGAVTVRGIHYSNTAGLQALDGTKYGTNHKGAEGKRLDNAEWVDDKYGDQYVVKHDVAYSAFPSKEGYGYASNQGNGPSSGPSVQSRAGEGSHHSRAAELRARGATTRAGIDGTLEQSGRSDADGDRCERGITTKDVRRAWHSQPVQLGAVNVGGIQSGTDHGG